MLTVMKNATENRTEGRTGNPALDAASNQNATMKSTITKINPPRDSSDYRKSAKRFTVYTDGKARDVADREYLTKFDLRKYNFKIASWARVGGFAAQIEADAAKAAIEAQFGVTVELKFSRYAGCSCGCSPGFVGKIVGGIRGELSRADVWMSEEIATEDEAAVVACAARMAKGLPAEIAKGEAKVAAEQAERKALTEAREREWAEINAHLEADKRRLAEQEAREELLAQQADVDRENALAMC